MDVDILSSRNFLHLRILYSRLHVGIYIPLSENKKKATFRASACIKFLHLKRSSDLKLEWTDNTAGGVHGAFSLHNGPRGLKGWPFVQFSPDVACVRVRYSQAARLHVAGCRRNACILFYSAPRLVQGGYSGGYSRSRRGGCQVLIKGVFGGRVLFPRGSRVASFRKCTGDEWVGDYRGGKRARQRCTGASALTQCLRMRPHETRTQYSRFCRVGGSRGSVNVRTWCLESTEGSESRVHVAEVEGR